MIRLDLWLEKYLEIAEIMGYDVARDRWAAENFAKTLRARSIEPPLDDLRRLLFKKPVIVFGAGPTLDDHVDRLLRIFPEAFKRFTLISADGATQALVERGVSPHIVVTDLDGDVGAILSAARRGSIIVVHVHGDNVEKVTRCMGEIFSVTRRVLGTTQVEPVPPLQNFGGFTDGDRAVFMAASYRASAIVLIGMDFGKVVGRRSKPWLRRDVTAKGDKLKKLKIAYDLVSWLALNPGPKIYTVSTNVPPGTAKIRLDDLNGILGCRP
ncbi:MAG: hypothetical protein AYL32_015020 [Candidatus Bathyarchaeota archaeon B26-2]|nr:MAG: hypothetical protein AYL32_015020 [Candidatus Bathyarchaeota archaeon B26-2]